MVRRPRERQLEELCYALRMRFLSLVLCTALAVGAAAQTPGKKWSRDWKIYVITHTHADIGYTDLIPEVERVWAQGMDMAVAASEKGLKWTLEGSLLFDAYARHRKPEKVRQLVGLVRKGSIEIASLYTNIEQENAGPEELIRASYYANETLRRQYGIEAKTAMLSDITGLTCSGSSLPTAAACSRRCAAASTATIRRPRSSCAPRTCKRASRICSPITKPWEPIILMTPFCCRWPSTT
jgi:hypothetical protein